MSSHPTRIALAGVHGFGAVHRANLARLGDRVSLVAVADPVRPESGVLPEGTEWFASLDDLLARIPGIDIVIVATPINSHARLAITALRAGADVLVEKPTAASMADFDALMAVQAQTGRSVQVGFQSLGSHALPGLADGSIGGIGSPWSVSAFGAWVRPLRYWSRAPWAGKRQLNGEDVVDGVTTNPLAHAVATALAIAGARTTQSVARVDADLYRVNDIEADDTSVVRVVTSRGIPVTSALTLDAATESLPFVTVRGEHGSLTFWYTEDLVRFDDGSEQRFGRTDLLENLLDHREHGTALLSSLESTGAFMSVVESVRLHDPAAIAPEFVEWVGDGPDSHPVLRDVETWLARATDAQATLTELGVPWAGRRSDAVLGSTAFADYQDGRSITPTSSPRPYLHPIRTPGGVVVSDHHPADHDWHFGLSVSLQDVGGINFWGGRTYVRDRGYVWRNDHGRVESREPVVDESGVTDRREWRAPDGSIVLEEVFDLRLLGEGRFDLSFTLTGQAQLGSPGSNGREGGGYGGLAIRLAPCTDVVVRTPAATGEAQVHGHVAPWIAWSARFEGGPATIALAPNDPVTALDPWFVRVDAYPGLGSALAWDAAVPAPVTRSFRGVVADGILSTDDVERMLAR